MSRDGASKQWCFTINNYTDAEYVGLRERAVAQSTYCIVGKERGEEGTPHLQGYIILNCRKRLAGVKAIISERAHFEKAKGSPQANYDYCSKEGDYWEHGDRPAGNLKKRSRDQIAADFIAAAEGADLEDFRARNPGVWYYDGRRLCENYLLGRPAIDRPDIRCVWLYGSPGVGKSRAAHEQLDRAYLKEPRTKWWNGYMLEPDCIIDDFGPNGIDLNHLLRWFDRYKCLVEVKGSMVPLYVRKFVVTSNYHPRDVFKDKDGHEHAQTAALMRRLVVYCVNDYASAKHVLTQHLG